MSSANFYLNKDRLYAVSYWSDGIREFLGYYRDINKAKEVVKLKRRSQLMK